MFASPLRFSFQGSKIRGTLPHRALFPVKKTNLSLKYSPQNSLSQRSFYSSKFFLNDDKKKAPPTTDPKIQQARKTSTIEQSRPTGSTQIPKSAVIPTPGATSAPRTVVRGPEDLDAIKTNIAKLLEQEIETVKEEALAVDAHTDLTKQFLAKTKYEITEGKEGEITMKRTQGNQTITVIFNKNEPAEAQEFDQMEEEAESAAKETDDLVSKEGATGALPQKQSVQIEVTFADKKGKWLLGGFAGKDNRLYIEDMSVAQGDEAPEQSLDALPFESLTDELQDRIYDYLDEVAVDDQLAHFVKHYTAECETKSAVKFLENLKDFMR